jgi:hypothetical protein
MADYDWRIQQLEEEARHEKAMREIHAGHLDAHDRSISAVDSSLATVGVRLEEITAFQKQLAIDQIKTEKMLQDLISLPTRSNTNGKP